MSVSYPTLNFDLGEEIDMLRDSVRAFCDAELAPRAAEIDELYDAAHKRLRQLAKSGVATVEVKSGYGLDQDAELRMLRAARRLGELRQVRVLTSFLGAHATPAAWLPANGFPVGEPRQRRLCCCGQCRKTSWRRLQTMKCWR